MRRTCLRCASFVILFENVIMRLVFFLFQLIYGFDLYFYVSIETQASGRKTIKYTQDYPGNITKGKIIIAVSIC